MSRTAGPPGEWPRLTLALLGPTGTGKTALACAIADRLPARLVSCDAIQVYRGLEAASAKPTAEERRHPWALVDWVEPDDPVDLGRWVRAAERELRAARDAGQVPVVAGGTGLYLRGLAKGVAAAPGRNEPLRRRLDALAARRGAGFLHRVLGRLDPASAARLGTGDQARLVRALEVRMLTGVALSTLQAASWRGPDRFPLLRVGLDLPRALLYERLDRRVERFFAAGLVDEVRALLDQRGLPPSANALRGIGYREVVEWLTGRSAARDLDELVALVQRNTRRYAKRQMTWFRREHGTRWFDARDPEFAERVIDLVEQSGRRPV